MASDRCGDKREIESERDLLDRKRIGGPTKSRN
jgi:hypothetical protein